MAVVSESGVAPVVCMVSERLLTGSSLMLKGRFGEGLLYTALGMLAYNFFGLPGVLLVSANSFALSQTDENLVQLASNPGTFTYSSGEPPAASASSKKS